MTFSTKTLTKAGCTSTFGSDFTCNVHKIPPHINNIDHVTWYNGAIPEGEVWLKLGGNKQGGMFKLCFQYLNVPSPNSPDNPCIFTLFEAPDN